jgi:hypothetical protein
LSAAENCGDKQKDERQHSHYRLDCVVAACELKIQRVVLDGHIGHRANHCARNENDRGFLLDENVNREQAVLARGENVEPLLTGREDP